MNLKVRVLLLVRENVANELWQMVLEVMLWPMRLRRGRVHQSWRVNR